MQAGEHTFPNDLRAQMADLILILDPEGWSYFEILDPDTDKAGKLRQLLTKMPKTPAQCTFRLVDALIHVQIFLHIGVGVLKDVRL